MPPTQQDRLAAADVAVLRGLAQRKLEIASDHVNLDRKRLWHLLDDGRAERPMILTEANVAFDDLADARLTCQKDWARGLEYWLRFEIFIFEKIRDDHVIEPWANCNWNVQTGHYGVEVKTVWAEKARGNVASRRWEPPLKDLQRDAEKLRRRTFTVNRQATAANKARLEEVCDGTLPVRIRGGFFWSLGMTQQLIDLVGLENMMLSMYTDPKGLHQVMAFLRDDWTAFVDWLQAENLLSLNNENDYIGSGSMGYSRALPRPEWRPGDAATPADLWGLSESQETTSVSPEMFREFVFQYQLPLISRFGRSYYGCCEPLHTRWHILKTIPNLARVSISPWCNEEFMAEACGRRYVYSRKPSPALISTERFDENAIREDLRKTLRIAAGCNVEFFMKDVHTLAGHPERLARWVELAREVIAESR